MPAGTAADLWRAAMALPGLGCHRSCSGWNCHPSITGAAAADHGAPAGQDVLAPGLPASPISVISIVSSWDYSWYQTLGVVVHNDHSGATTRDGTGRPPCTRSSRICVGGNTKWSRSVAGPFANLTGRAAHESCAASVGSTVADDSGSRDTLLIINGRLGVDSHAGTCRALDLTHADLTACGSRLI